MGAPKGNQFWKLRSKHGRDKIFSSPEMLWEAACEYFEWADKHPWLKYDTVKAGDHFGENVAAPVQRPYTLEALCLYLDCDTDTFKNYCEKEQYKDFFVVSHKIRDIIRNMKYEGAVVGAFNANIVARDLSLSEHHKHEGLNLTIKANNKDEEDDLNNAG